MGGYQSTPLSIKKYIKVPPRKLISGFLHVNVVSHEDNDGYEDAYTWYRNKLVSGSGIDNDWHQANPFRGQAASEFDDAGRSNKKLSFGDYDCLLFWVAGGMTLQDPILGSLVDGATLAGTGYSDTTQNAWYTSIDDYCQNFIKYDLISRINNGYGHGELMGDEKYTGAVAVTKNEFRADEAGISGHDCSSAAPAYAGLSHNSHGGNFQKHIVSCGSYSNSGHGNEDLSAGDQNTFFPPVQSVEVYGQHHTNVVSQTNGSTPLYSISPSSTPAGYHSKEFWNLVIEVKIRGFDDGWTSGSPSQADMEFFKSRTNIFFQPFGETASFNISDTPHTS